MELIEKAICTIGMMMFFLGASAMDSESLIFPAALCIIGGLLMLATYHAYKL